MSDLTTIHRFIPKLEYDQVDECDYVSMEEDLHGDYVRFADYDQLRAEVERLRSLTLAQNQNLLTTTADLQAARKAMEIARSALPKLQEFSAEASNREGHEDWPSARIAWKAFDETMKDALAALNAELEKK